MSDSSTVLDTLTQAVAALEIGDFKLSTALSDEALQAALLLGDAFPVELLFSLRNIWAISLICWGISELEETWSSNFGERRAVANLRGFRGTLKLARNLQRQLGIRAAKGKPDRKLT